MKIYLLIAVLLPFIPDPLSALAYQSGITRCTRKIIFCMEQTECITDAMKMAIIQQIETNYLGTKVKDVLSRLKKNICVDFSDKPDRNLWKIFVWRTHFFPETLEFALNPRVLNGND